MGDGPVGEVIVYSVIIEHFPRRLPPGNDQKTLLPIKKLLLLQNTADFTRLLLPFALDPIHPVYSVL